jgi:hypothetical protein
MVKSAPHSPKMNAICERVIGTIRRECLDWLIPLSESHLRFILKSWIARTWRWVPGCPIRRPPRRPSRSRRHRRGESYAVRAASVLGGLHHEYSLAAAFV